MNHQETYVQIWTPSFPFRSLSYRWPPLSPVQPRIGLRVIIPLRNTHTLGYVEKVLKKKPDIDKVREVAFIIDKEPFFREIVLEMARWASDYYMQPLGAFLHGALPPKLHDVYEVEVSITESGLREAMVIASKGKKRMRSAEKILLYLAERKKTTLKTLKRQLKIRHLYKIVQELHTRNFIRVEEKMRVFARVRPVKVLRLMRYPDENERLTAKQREVLDIIREFQRDVLYTEIEHYECVTYARVRRLVKRGFLAVYEQYRPQHLEHRTLRPYDPNFIVLTKKQIEIVSKIARAIEEERFHPAVLFGVTASGKTEVYMECAMKALDKGKDVLILVPEIAIIPSVLDRFRTQFGSKLAILHSGLTPRQRFDEWMRIWNGEASVVVGTRLAVFAPLRQPGLIVVDEEHDSSYKQTSFPIYHARELALFRAHRSSCPILLVSATPDIETYGHALEGLYSLYKLEERVLPEANPPEIVIVDMRNELTETAHPYFSRALLKELENTLAKKEQAFVLINRKGYAPVLMCRACGTVIQCTYCSAHLVFHKKPDRLICHYCGFTRRPPQKCPDCSEKKYLALTGAGTQKILEILKDYFPSAVIERFDRETASDFARFFDILARFERREIDILVGTQMLAKGHHFPYVTCVGVIDADGVTGIPGYKTRERQFQLLLQVAGRAGRADKPGKSLFQSFMPDAYPIRFAMEQDYEGFFREEIRNRQRFQLPPFTTLIDITVQHRDMAQAKTLAESLADALRENPPEGMRVQGPITSYLYKLKGKYRFHVLIKTTSRKATRKHIRKTLERFSVHVSTFLIDVDPEMIL